MTIVKKKNPQILIKWSKGQLMNVRLKWEICHQNCLQLQRKEPGSATRSEVTIFMIKQYLEELERLLAKINTGSTLKAQINA